MKINKIIYLFLILMLAFSCREKDKVIPNLSQSDVDPSVEQDLADLTNDYSTIPSTHEVNELVESYTTSPITECELAPAPTVETYNEDKAMTQEVLSDSSKTFQPGCEVLKEDTEDSTKLAKCFSSIKSAITLGARNKNGSLNREALFCNMYKNLRPEEQHFAGLMFTSIGEAGVIVKDKLTAAPKYQEQLFVKKSIDNRLKSARAKKGSHINALDIALADQQYSMYNEEEFSKFQSRFDPNTRSRSNDIEVENAVSSYIEHTKGTGLSPKDLAYDVGNYYNPHAMAKTSDPKKIARVKRLKAQGKIPASHPNNRVAPKWDFSKLTPVYNLSFKGVPVNTKKPQMHVYYVQNDKNLYYGIIPSPWRKKCAK